MVDICPARLVKRAKKIDCDGEALRNKATLMWSSESVARNNDSEEEAKEMEVKDSSLQKGNQKTYQNVSANLSFEKHFHTELVFNQPLKTTVVSRA